MKKKLIIIGIVTAAALGVLTACTKTEESVNNGNSSEEEEELPQNEDPEKPQNGVSERPAEEDADAQDDEPKSSGDAEALSAATELNGIIEEVPGDSGDSFIIAKLVTERVNGVDLISTDENETKVTVVYSDDTGFVKRTIRDDGENVEEKAGSAADLQKNFTVEMKGSYNGEEVFIASEIKIVEVVLN